jgi:hypothetical protein
LVLTAWIEVESAALDAVLRNELSLAPREGATPRNVIRALRRSQLVDPGQASIFHDLRSLRNEAAHAPDFALSPESALEYAEVARRLAEYLRSLGSS